jgi:hypothetical protein
MSCSIENVLAPNGEPSKLFNDMASLTRDSQRALILYLESKAMGPGDFLVDENGEPQLSEIIHVLPGLTTLDQERFFSNRPDILDMPATSSYQKRKARTTQRRKELLKENLAIEALMNKTLAGLKRSRDNARDSDVRGWYQDQINKLQDQRNRVFWADDIDSVKKIAIEQLEWARKMVSSRNPSKQAIGLAADLVTAWSWETTSRFLSEDNDAEGSLWAEVFGAISEEAHRLDLTLLKSLRHNVLKDINKSGIPTEAKDLLVQTEIGFTRRVLFDLGTVDSKLAQYIDSTLKDAARNQAGVLARISKELAARSVGVQMSNLLQKNKDGNITGSLITPYSSEYQDLVLRATSARRIQLENATKASTLAVGIVLTSAANRNYYQKRRQVDIAIDIRKLRGPDRAKYEQRLVDQLGPEIADNAIADAERAYIEYKKERENAEARFQAEVVGGEAELLTIGGQKELTSEYIARRLDEWEKANSPDQYLEEFYARSKKVYHSTEGEGFVVHVPKMKQSNGELTGHYDQAYKDLNDVDREFLDYVLGLSKNLLAYLPKSETRDLGAGFLPVIQKTILEQVLGNGSWADLQLKGGYLAAREKLLRSFTDEQVLKMNAEQERSRVALNPITGDPVRSIPIKYIEGAKIRRKKGETDEAYNARVKDVLSGRSFDLIKIMEMFAAMAINYKHMSDVEGKVLLAQRVMNEAEEIRTRGGGAIHDFFGKLVTQKDGKTQLKQMTQYAIDGMLYGAKRKEEEYVTSFALYDVNPLIHGRKATIAAQLRKEHLDLQEAYDNKEIEEEVYQAEKNRIESEYEALGGRRLSVGKSMDNLLAFTQAKGMGWNLTAGIANVGFGIMSNIIHSGANIDFNERELMTASRIMLAARKSGTGTKAYNMIRLLDVLFEITEIGYGKNADRAKFKNIEWAKNPYEVQRRTEFFLQGTSVVAQLMHEKITDLSGKERSLWDAFTNEGTWNEAEFGPQPDEWKTEDLGADTKNSFTRFRNKVIGVNKKLHGNYDPNSPVEAKKWVAGRALLMFRSWMAEGFEWRFAHQRYDDQLGREIKGRWLSYRDQIKEHGFPQTVALVAKMMVNKTKFSEGMSELDRQNMMSNIMELRFYIALSAAMVMLKYAMGDDDDEEEGIGLATARILISQLYRVEADMTFYISPSTMLEISKNPVPAFKTITDFQDAMSSTFDYVNKPDYEGLHPAAKWGKAFPIGTQAYKMWYMGSNDINWE